MSFYGTFFVFKGSTGASYCGAAKIDQVVQLRRWISLKEPQGHCRAV